jgi:hypothetical protein
MAALVLVTRNRLDYEHFEGAAIRDDRKILMQSQATDGRSGACDPETISNTSTSKVPHQG